MMVKMLRIFDFDGTLCDTPANTPENKKLYEKHTGLPWDISKDDAVRLSRRLGRPVNPRRGWWGRAESLQPPIVPDPAPLDLWVQSTVDTFEANYDEPETYTVLLTGRHAGLEQEVLRIVHQGPLNHLQLVERTEDPKYRYRWVAENAACHLLGNNGPCPDMVGPKPADTYPWKVWIIQQYRLVYPELEAIVIWEDRDEHVEMFRTLNDEFQESVTVYHVK